MCKHRCNRWPRLVSLILFGLVSLSASNLSARPLQILVTNNQSPEADLYLAVYLGSDDKGWQQEPSHTERFVLPQEQKAEFVLDIPDGAYAIRAFVDLNGNGELETRSFNRPEEPFSISQGNDEDEPSIHFDKAVFPLNESNTSVELLLIYPKGSQDQQASAAPSEGNQ